MRNDDPADDRSLVFPLFESIAPLAPLEEPRVTAVGSQIAPHWRVRRRPGCAQGAAHRHDVMRGRIVCGGAGLNYSGELSYTAARSTAREWAALGYFVRLECFDDDAGRWLASPEWTGVDNPNDRDLELFR